MAQNPIWSCITDILRFHLVCQENNALLKRGWEERVVSQEKIQVYGTQGTIPEVKRDPIVDVDPYARLIKEKSQEEHLQIIYPHRPRTDQDPLAS